MFSDLGAEIESVRAAVSARFPVYDTRVTPQAVAFLVNVDPATMEKKFDDLRLELVPKDYIPSLTKQGGEYTVLVQRRPSQRFVGSHVNLLLLIATIITTTFAGALNWAGYDDIDWLSLDAFAKGSLFFTLPLMAILGIHEMGHYVIAQRYRVHASLPFFIPAPATFLGTFGAMISMRDPIPSRKALIDIGAAGPILGLITAIPVTILGLVLMQVDPRPAPLNSGGGLEVELPFLYQLLSYFVPIPNNVILHPTAFAGWVGLFVTALNLMPAGQLDGGHVARAVLGENSRYLSYAAIFGMILLGFWYFGWFIIAVFIMFMGARHPPPLNDLTRLDGKRHAVGALALAVLLLSFVAIPVNLIEPIADIQFESENAPAIPVTELNVTAAVGTATSYTFRIVNLGNVETWISLNLSTPNFPGNLSVAFANLSVGNRSIQVGASDVNFTLNATESANVTLSVDATNYSLAPDDKVFFVKARVKGEGLRAFDQPELTFHLHVE
ncbi:MAG: site-2 protease family protein [Euryarchaeota archaeon]|nr:site-2 protease family protein [Euryarchaeota archaeon]